MPFRPRVGALLALSLLLVPMAACRGNDQDGGRGSRGSGSSADGRDSSSQLKERNCRVTVTLTGAVRQVLQGAGRAIYDNPTGPKAFYQFSSGPTSVQVYSDGEDFRASIVIDTRSGSFTSERGTKGLDVSPSGRFAEVDSDMVGLDEGSRGVHVKAVYRCA